jgi:hypothetical protein
MSSVPAGMLSFTGAVFCMTSSLPLRDLKRRSFLTPGTFLALLTLSGTLVMHTTYKRTVPQIVTI